MSYAATAALPAASAHSLSTASPRRWLGRCWLSRRPPDGVRVIVIDAVDVVIGAGPARLHEAAREAHACSDAMSSLRDACAMKVGRSAGFGHCAGRGSHAAPEVASSLGAEPASDVLHEQRPSPTEGV